MDSPAHADLDERLGLLLKRQRQDLKLTQADVALRSGLTSRYVRKVECGLASPTLQAFVKLSAALEINPTDLMRRLMGA